MSLKVSKLQEEIAALKVIVEEDAKFISHWRDKFFQFKKIIGPFYVRTSK